MAKGIRRVDSFILHANDRPGEGAHMLKTLKKHRVNLLALTATPLPGGTQVELIPEDSAQLAEVAKKYDWKLSARKSGFLAQGKDRSGALLKFAQVLGKAGINIISVDAIAAGADRYGAVFWVRPKDIEKAATVMGVK
ncbi:MAG TPA: hypothetical protein VLI06_07050 [Solimonas sp.]|nr:hypothetical protein [Solimonas sp.]